MPGVKSRSSTGDDSPFKRETVLELRLVPCNVEEILDGESDFIPLHVIGDRCVEDGVWLGLNGIRRIGGTR